MKKLSDHFNLRKSLIYFLQEDIGTGDITSENLENSNKSVTATIIFKSDFIGIICGIEEVQVLLDICNCNSTPYMLEGTKIRPKANIMEIYGAAKDELKAKRITLNLLMRVGGVEPAT